MKRLSKKKMFKHVASGHVFFSCIKARSASSQANVSLYFRLFSSDPYTAGQKSCTHRAYGSLKIGKERVKERSSPTTKQHSKPARCTDRRWRRRAMWKRCSAHSKRTGWAMQLSETVYMFIYVPPLRPHFCTSLLMSFANSRLSWPPYPSNM